MFPFKTALNTSTLLPFNLNVKEQIDVVSKAGYQGIELWVNDIIVYLQSGGTIKDLKDHIDDSGITLVNAIAFFKWTDRDESTRTLGFEQAKREMHLLAELGCKAVAAPPFGHVEGVPLKEIAKNFAELTGVARKIGIEPYLEFWGRAKNLSKLSEAIFVAKESGVDDTRILLDPFHMYIGGSDLNHLRDLTSRNIGIVHVNDYPRYPKREDIHDNERVFPGDGISNTKEFAKLLEHTGYHEYLSLELFVQDYREKGALEVVQYGLEKIKTAYSITC